VTQSGGDRARAHCNEAVAVRGCLLRHKRMSLESSSKDALRYVHICQGSHIADAHCDNAVHGGLATRIEPGRSRPKLSTSGDIMTKYFLAGALASSLLAITTLVHADSDCEKQASDKRLSGTAKVTFIANCEKNAAGDATADATKQCAKKAQDKGLSGAAKTSFVQQCAKDVAGSVQK